MEGGRVGRRGARLPLPTTTANDTARTARAHPCQPPHFAASCRI